MKRKHSKDVEAQMLIRKPVSQVFEAFINPEITIKFWFTKSSGRLEPGKKVRWDWEMFGVGDDLTVIGLVHNRNIFIKWDSNATTVEWNFEPLKDDMTLVKISTLVFSNNHEETLSMAIEEKGGYTMVLAGLKAWLEHGIELNLIGDQFPEGYPG
jgi:uncharacterized protein YndB with AHSA1/START domain